MAANNLKKILRFTGLAIWLALPIILLCLPADYFDTGRALCPSKLLFNIECPGCGLSRAMMHFIHLNFRKAWEFNKLIVIVAPMLLAVWIHVLGRLAGKNYLPWMRKFY